jgi:hypothetical protein
MMSLQLPKRERNESPDSCATKRPRSKDPADGTAIDMDPNIPDADMKWMKDYGMHIGIEFNYALELHGEYLELSQRAGARYPVKFRTTKAHISGAWSTTQKVHGGPLSKVR